MAKHNDKNNDIDCGKHNDKNDNDKNNNNNNDNNNDDDNDSDQLLFDSSTMTVRNAMANSNDSNQ